MRRFLAALSLAFAVLASPAVATDRSSGSSDGVITAEEVLAGVITEVERRIIGRYYKVDYGGGHAKHKKKAKGSQGLPPGLAKRAVLPPGLQRQLDKNGRLPPGLDKRLPADLLAALPRRPDADLVIVNDDIVLIARTTRLVLDVLENVVGGRAGS